MIRAQGLLFIFFLWTSLTMANEENPYRIEISASASEFVVGGSIQMTLVYRNATPIPIRFKAPLKKWETQILVARGQASPVERPFGRMRSYTTSAGIERRTVEAAEEIVLRPGEKVDYQYDVGLRWPELFPPGTMNVSIVDLSNEASNVKSNTLTWRISMQRESVEFLLSILESTERELDSKEFAATWLRKLNPNFHFDPEAGQPSDVQLNKAAVDEYRKWWKSHQNSEQVTKRLDSLNDVR
jgi:hypothetical protein